MLLRVMMVVSDGSFVRSFVLCLFVSLNCLVFYAGSENFFPCSTFRLKKKKEHKREKIR